ncbi:MAG: hypothetical protein WA004_21390 [Saprospiraceae bacterium]
MGSKERDFEGLLEKAGPKVEKLLQSTSPEETQLAALEKTDFEEEYRRKINETRLQSLRDDTEAKRKMTYWIFFMVAAWLVAILVMLVLAGFEETGFRLSDAVLIALLGSTTVNVTAFFLVVTKYLFPGTGKE